MSVLPSNTVAALTTPPGQGAIAVIEVHGPQAREAALRIFRAAKGGSPDQPLRLYTGVVHREGMTLDDVIVRIVPADRSFTGMEAVEIHSHGGSAPVEAVFHLLERHAVPRVPWHALVDLAYRNGKIDALQAEAHRWLPTAPTALAAAVLQDQARGALSQAVRAARTAEDVRRLLETSSFGCALASPRRVVIAGRPNVGKSTLFNALLEVERALVTPEAGTTRDPVAAIMAIDGVPFTLVDTAGIGTPKDALDAAGQQRAREELGAADLVLVVLEAGSEPGPEEQALRASLGSKPNLAVFNKSDLADVRRAILEALHLRPEYRPGSPVVFTRRQEILLGECSSNVSGLDRLFVFADEPKT